MQKIESRGKEDLKLKVFMLAYIDGKSNEEIMDEVSTEIRIREYDEFLEWKRQRAHVNE